MYDKNHPYSHDTNGQTTSGELTFADVLRRLRSSGAFILKVTAVFVVAGMVYVFGSRSEYSAGATLMPEKQNEGLGGGLGMLRQLGGLVGGLAGAELVNMKSALSADLYPEILQSVPVQWALLLREVQPRGGPPMTLLKYLDEHKPFDLWESGGDAVATVANSLLGGEQSTTITTLDSTIVRLSQEDARILDELRERVDAFFNLRTGILDISVDMPDPEVAAQVAGAAVEELTRYMKDYRRSKLEKDLEFIEIRHAEARARFNASLDDLARFRDRNQHLARDLARTEDQRLQAEYDLAFNVYNSLSTRLEESRIAVEEETPVFQVLEPVSVPLKKSYPARGLTLMLCGILGLVTGAGISIFREDLQSLARSSKTIWKREEEPAP